MKYDGCVEAWGTKNCGTPGVVVDEDWPMNDTNSDDIPDAWQQRGIFNFIFSRGTIIIIEKIPGGIFSI